MSHVIERRPYGPDSTPDEIAAILARVKLVNGDTAHWFELPVFTPYTLELMTGQIHKVTEHLPGYKLYISLTEAGRPNAEYREKLMHWFKSQTRIQRTAIYLGRRRVMTSVLKFLLSRFDMPTPIDLFSDEEAAWRFLADAD